MKAGFYVCICILILLILMFLITRYYLNYEYTSVVTVGDGELLDLNCLTKNHNIEIFYAAYRVRRGEQFNMKNSLNALLKNEQLAQNGGIFNASAYNLPSGGKLTFRFKCNTCNSGHTNDIIPITNPDDENKEILYKLIPVSEDSTTKNSFEPKRINLSYSAYVPPFPTTNRNAEGTVYLPGNPQTLIIPDSYGTSAESAQYPNFISGIGKRNLVPRLTPNPINHVKMKIHYLNLLRI